MMVVPSTVKESSGKRVERFAFFKKVFPGSFDDRLTTLGAVRPVPNLRFVTYEGRSETIAGLENS